MNGWEDSDCVEDGGDVGAAVVGGVALGLSSILGFQDDQLLKRPEERRR